MSTVLPPGMAVEEEEIRPLCLKALKFAGLALSAEAHAQAEKDAPTP